jgi:hypothetical protein
VISFASFAAEDFDIPTLDLDIQATRLIAPVLPYGSMSHRFANPGTWHFYVDDHKFTRLCARPEKILRSGCQAGIEPNFSTDANTPRIQALFDIYRKRSIARFWGDCGLKILVDLNVDRRFHDLILLGVPAGWRAYATRCHRGGSLADIEEDRRIAEAHAGTDALLFVVVGGGKAVKAACADRGWTHVPEHCRVVRRLAEAYADER